MNDTSTNETFNPFVLGDLIKDLITPEIGLVIRVDVDRIRIFWSKSPQQCGLYPVASAGAWLSRVS